MWSTNFILRPLKAVEFLVDAALLIITNVITIYLVVFTKCNSEDLDGYFWVCVVGGVVCTAIFMSNPTKAMLGLGEVELGLGF